MEQNARIREKHGMEDIRDIQLTIDNLSAELKASLDVALEWQSGDTGYDKRTCGWITYEGGVLTVTLGDAIPWINPGHERGGGD